MNLNTEEIVWLGKVGFWTGLLGYIVYLNVRTKKD